MSWIILGIVAGAVIYLSKHKITNNKNKLLDPSPFFTICKNLNKRTTVIAPLFSDLLSKYKQNLIYSELFLKQILMLHGLHKQIFPFINDVDYQKDNDKDSQEIRMIKYFITLNEKILGDLTERDIKLDNRLCIDNNKNKKMSDKTMKLIKKLYIDVIDKQKYQTFTSDITINFVWKYRFNPRFTVKKLFYSSEQIKTETHMMQQENLFDYYENDDIMIIKIDGKDDLFSMIFILSRKTKRLYTLSSKELWEYLEKLKPQLVYIQIPRLNMETTISLVDIVNQRMDVDLETKIKEIKQHFTVTYNETGRLDVNPNTHSNKKTKVKKFIANRPFIYYLIHQPSQQIILGGAYLVPIINKDNDVNSDENNSDNNNSDTDSHRDRKTNELSDKSDNDNDKKKHYKPVPPPKRRDGRDSVASKVSA